MNEEVARLVKIIWNYMNISDTLEKCDCILCFGSSNLDSAKHAATLYLEGYSNLIVFTGGLGKITKKMWDETEADKFAKTAINMGVLKEDIIIENKSTNTGENIEFAKKILEEKNVNPKSFIVVADPMAERRVYAASLMRLKNKKILTSSPRIDFDEYLKRKLSTEVSEVETISNYVGDVQRMKLYAEKGWQVPQEIPNKVKDAVIKLAKLGYDKYVYGDKNMKLENMFD